ncbi:MULTISPECIES: ArsR/SmtB family transcription factor [Halorubrum]|uniref:Helix-turn-helix domain-containing protein n=1 Tax=Halorubrum sodomense TaxID=35743 RepID=A0A1I6GUK8_HALSD|nr:MULTISPECIES: winged helix-turn-helix domain-containing protein [Halorubrum]TKX54720.1 ArsR family transcriptional regulator [Halorubrum sp. SP3]TKX69827.1 ArsR family transcriptional regulator [Halorubrum sp. SP9]SFR45747.1 Helix-turn-helix domain-containing protein [Halorubrum sodomense]
MSRLLPSLPDATPEEREPRVVGVDDDEADDLIAALGSETARAILSTLHERPATKSELADEVDTSLQNVQYHLSRLDEADLVDVVDTAYSEKGREMDVYAAADEPLVLFAGGSEESTGIKTALMRLLGGYGIIGLAAVAAQRLLAVGSLGGYRARSDAGAAGGAGGDGGAADGPTIASAPNADSGAETADGAIELVGDPLAEYAVSLVEPGLVFFVAAALVFTLAWAYWYRASNR